MDEDGIDFLKQKGLCPVCGEKITEETDFKVHSVKVSNRTNKTIVHPHCHNKTVTARIMLSNSEFIVMNNQAASDRAELAKLLNISEQQLSYVTNADAGCGLM